MSSAKSIKKHTLGIFVLFLVFVAIILYVFFFQGNYQFSTNNNSNNNSTDNSSIILTEENIKEIKERENITFSSIATSTLENYPITSKPNFKIGEKYAYNIKYPNTYYGMKNDPNMILNDYIYFNVTFEVKDKKRINKTEWYLISTDGSGQVIMGYIRTTSTGVVKPLKRTMVGLAIIYINTENGEVMDGGELDRFRIYSPWMLKLSKDLKWTEKIEENSTGSIGGTNGKYNVTKKNLNNVREESYEVKGIEKINGRDCFKVESRVKSCTNQKCIVKYKKLFWIDVKKRITVKFQLWYENLNTINVDLVNYEK